MKTVTVLGIKMEATPEMLAGARVGRSVGRALRQGKLSRGDAMAISDASPELATAELSRRGLLLPPIEPDLEG